MTTKTVDVEEAKTQLADLIVEVESGTVIIVTKDNTPRARLVPFASPSDRIAGLHQGTIWTSDDFDEPLPDEFWMGGE